MTDDGNREKIRNLGPRSMEWLAEIGIRDLGDLEEIGSVEAYRLLRERGFPVSMNLVYAIEGALLDVDWRNLPFETKAALKAAMDRI